MKNVAKQRNQKAENDLFYALSLCKTPGEQEKFMRDLCTAAELSALAERWNIARILNSGEKSYRDISVETGASTTTIGRVARFLSQEPHQGYRLVIQRLKEEE